MKEGKAIRDTQVKAIKTVLKESNFELIQTNNSAYSELDKAVVKIVNVRKYKNDWGSGFLYEFDGYYRNKIGKIIANEIKYFGVDTRYDNVNIKKITYKEIV